MPVMTMRDDGRFRNTHWRRAHAPSGYPRYDDEHRCRHRNQDLGPGHPLAEISENPLSNPRRFTWRCRGNSYKLLRVATRPEVVRFDRRGR